MKIIKNVEIIEVEEDYSTALTLEGVKTFEVDGITYKLSSSRNINKNKLK